MPCLEAFWCCHVCLPHLCCAGPRAQWTSHTHPSAAKPVPVSTRTGTTPVHSAHSTMVSLVYVQTYLRTVCMCMYVYVTYVRMYVHRLHTCTSLNKCVLLYLVVSQWWAGSLLKVSVVSSWQCSLTISQVCCKCSCVVCVHCTGYVE